MPVQGLNARADTKRIAMPNPARPSKIVSLKPSMSAG